MSMESCQAFIMIKSKWSSTQVTVIVLKINRRFGIVGFFNIFFNFDCVVDIEYRLSDHVFIIYCVRGNSLV
jgi:hypothetical protein